MPSDCNAVYSERNLLVQLLAVLLLDNPRHNAGIRFSLTDPDWPILFLDIDGVQLSWHIAIADLLAVAWPVYQSDYDGHSTNEKYERIKEMILNAKF